MARRGGNHDYMMRSEKRPGQQRPTGSVEPRRRQRKPKRHPIYAFFTILALIILYPIGLIMLWVRKLHWRMATKMLVSVVTCLLFFVFVGFILTVEVTNPTLKTAQENAKDQWMQAANAVRVAVSNRENIENNLMEQGPKLVDMAVDSARQMIVRDVPRVQENLNKFYNDSHALGTTVSRFAVAQKDDLLVMLGMATPAPAVQATPTIDPASLISPSPEVESMPSDEPSVEPAITPDTSSIDEPVDSEKTPTITPDATLTVEPTTAVSTQPSIAPVTASNVGSINTIPSETPEPVAPIGAEAVDTSTETANPFVASPLPTTTPEALPVPPISLASFSPTAAPTLAPTPTVTPTPTPSPTPIILPTPKSYLLTKVYYYDTGRGYHVNPTCSGMRNAPEHTLEEAFASNKNPCTTCKAPSRDLTEAALVVWSGSDMVFHITDECPNLASPWVLQSFEEAWLEDGFTGCILCESDLFIQAQKRQPEATPVPAPAVT